MKRKIYNTTIENYNITIKFTAEKEIYLQIEEDDNNNWDDGIVIDYLFEDKKILLKIVNYIKNKLEGKKNVRKTDED
jgi:hypothetical protein